LSESLKCTIHLNCLHRAETTGETYIRTLFEIQGITKGFDNEPKKIYTDINWPVSYSENYNDLLYHLNNNIYFKRIQIFLWESSPLIIILYVVPVSGHECVNEGWSFHAYINV
jgi:hypothetical protein